MGNLPKPPDPKRYELPEGDASQWTAKQLDEAWSHIPAGGAQRFKTLKKEPDDMTSAELEEAWFVTGRREAVPKAAS